MRVVFGIGLKPWVRVHASLVVQFDVCTRRDFATDADAISIGVAKLELHKAVEHFFRTSEQLRPLFNRGSNVEHSRSGNP